MQATISHALKFFCFLFLVLACLKPLIGAINPGCQVRLTELGAGGTGNVGDEGATFVRLNVEESIVLSNGQRLALSKKATNTGSIDSLEVEMRAANGNILWIADLGVPGRSNGVFLKINTAGKVIEVEALVDAILVDDVIRWEMMPPRELVQLFLFDWSIDIDTGEFNSGIGTFEKATLVRTGLFGGRSTFDSGRRFLERKSIEVSGSHNAATFKSHPLGSYQHSRTIGGGNFEKVNIRNGYRPFHPLIN